MGRFRELVDAVAAASQLGGISYKAPRKRRVHAACFGLAIALAGFGAIAANALCPGFGYQIGPLFAIVLVPAGSLVAQRISECATFHDNEQGALDAFQDALGEIQKMNLSKADADKLKIEAYRTWQADRYCTRNAPGGH